MAYGNDHLESCVRDFTACPDIKIMIPSDLISLSSALEKKLGNQGVVIIVVECI
jgi:hypothetical protein